MIDLDPKYVALVREILADHIPDKTVLLDLWLVTEFIGEPQGKENQAVKWVDYAELMKHQLLEGNVPLLSKIKNLF